MDENAERRVGEQEVLREHGVPLHPLRDEPAQIPIAAGRRLHEEVEDDVLDAGDAGDAGEQLARLVPVRRHAAVERDDAVDDRASDVVPDRVVPVVSNRRADGPGDRVVVLPAGNHELARDGAYALDLEDAVDRPGLHPQRRHFARQGDLGAVDAVVDAPQVQLFTQRGADLREHGGGALRGRRRRGRRRRHAGQRQQDGEPGAHGHRPPAMPALSVQLSV